ncbi:hypothetical protein [Chitinophaga sp. MM2321]|uniref:hypothetical protein n=1 Tax=Chitinophaga sp. MM2321 TaxID=3137178 RepID=UPI0032D5770A
MFSSNLKIYDIFRKDLHLSDDKAKELVLCFDQSLCNYHMEKQRELATKLELYEVKAELKQDIHDLKTELKNDIHETRSELRTMIFAVGLFQFIAIVGTVLAIVRFMIQK